MVEDGKIDWKKLEETVRKAVHFLDNVIDANKYPLKEIEAITKGNRKIGLGVMGFADMLIKVGLPYNARAQPIFAISFMRNVLGGTRLFETNPLFETIAKERGLYSAKLLEEIAKTGSVQKIDGVPENIKRLFVTALDIEPEWHVRMQAAFQKYTDNAVSKTVNLPNEARIEDVRKVFKLAWKLKCKEVTVFRYGSKPEQVLYIGKIRTKERQFVTAESEYAGGCPTKTCPFPD
jgi:ribonucleotide reductase alpha subunit